MITVHQYWLQTSSLRHLLYGLSALLVCMLLFWPLVRGFQANTAGLLPLDNQLGLSSTELYRQLAHYSESSRHYYAAFAALDFVFPALLSLTIALLWGWMLNRSGTVIRQHPAAVYLLLLPLAGTASDWLENIATLQVIFHYPEQSLAASWALHCKNAKLALLAINGSVSLLLACCVMIEKRRHK